MRKEMSLVEVKQTELEILQYVDKVLKTNNIQYFLDGGTLLGSIRHHGFIPWDDDIDIIVQRKDYMRAINVLAQQRTKYKVLSRYTNHQYFYPFAKIVDSETELIENEQVPHIEEMGIYIDIFPLDHLPDDDKRRHSFQNKVWFFRMIIGQSLKWEMKIPEKNPIQWVKMFIMHMYGWKRALVAIDHLCEKQLKEDTNHVCDIVAASRKHMSCEASAFDKAEEGTFEGCRFPIPIGFDQYLTMLYGKYMELPPEEKRVSNHDFKAYRNID